MADCMVMMKYQGLGNDYLVLDPNKNGVHLQGKKIALMCQAFFTGRWISMAKWAFASITRTEASLPSAETA